MRPLLSVLVFLVVSLTTCNHTEVQYWRSVAPDTPHRKACLGLSLFHARDANEAMPLLFEATKLLPADFVSWEHLAAGFSMAARRLSAAGSPERASLEKSAWLFARAAKARAGAPPNPYPQIHFDQPREQVLRSWGDALMWLSRVDEARAVFGGIAASALWPDPLCRPVSHLRSKLDLSRSYFLDSQRLSRAMSHVLLPIRKEMIPAVQQDLSQLRHGGAELVWTREAAGLASSGGWSYLLLWADGKPGDACSSQLLPKACALLLGLLKRVPALRVRNGQVKLSRMLPGTVVKPHAGPTNARLRMHCTVHIAERRLDNETFIRVGTERRSWVRDGCFVFREDCEHEVRISSRLLEPRVVLIVDFGNPFLASAEAYKRTVFPSDVIEGGGGDMCVMDDRKDSCVPALGGDDATREYDGFIERSKE